MDIRLFLSLATMIFSLMVGECAASTYFVRQSGDDNNPGTSRDYAFRTITKAAATAGSGDTVHIGAGVYDETIYFNGARKATTGWAEFRGDESGTATGDRGTVVIRSWDNHWGFYAYNVSSLLFTGITFEAHPNHTDRSYGCYIRECSGETKFANCKFTDVVYAARFHSTGSASVDNCHFVGVRYGAYASATTRFRVGNSRFDASRYSVLFYDTADATVADCVFTDTHPVTGVVETSSGVRFTRSSAVVERCDFSGNDLGVYAYEAGTILIDGCEFDNSTSHAVYCYGESSEVKDCHIHDGNYGVTLVDSSGRPAQLTDLVIEKMYMGVSARETDYDFDNVTISESQYGIHQRSTCPLLTIKNTDSIKFSDNDYALYSNHTSTGDGTLNVDGQDFRGNESGVLSYDTDVSINNSQFEGERWGARLVDCDVVDITGCTFNGNPANPSGCSYGIYASSEDIQIQNTTSRNANYGILLDLAGEQPPVIKDVTSEDNAYAALYVRGGKWTYTDADRNSFRNSSRGVIGSEMNWRIENVTTDGSCEYPIMDYSGDCVIDGASVTAKITGVYANRSNSLTMSNVNSSNCGVYGIYGYDVDDVAIDNCAATNNSSGIYLNDPDGTVASITNSRLESNDRYGLLLSGVTLDHTVAANLTVKDNQYGISVHHRPFTINDGMKLTVTGNRYGVMSYYSDLIIDSATISGNQISAYAYDSDVDVDGFVSSSSSYGLLGRPSNQCKIVNSEFNDATYGVSVQPLAALNNPIEIHDVLVNNSTGLGIYIRGLSSNPPTLDLRNSKITNSHHGLVFYDTEVQATGVSMDTLTGVGFYQVSGSSKISNCSVNGANRSWSVYARGDRCDISRCKLTNGAYGVGFRNQNGSITNSVLHNFSYSVYVNATGEFDILQTTIAGTSDYAVLTYSGDTTVRNSIVESARYGFYKVGPGDLGGDHNLVTAQIREHTNSTAGVGEVNKAPIFMDPSAGDLRLAAGSPAINAGVDLSATITSDIDGNGRPSFRAFEIGAYEYLAPAGSLRVLDWDEVAR